MESFVFGYFGGRDKKLGTAKALIRVDPLNLSSGPVNWEELTRKPYLTVSAASPERTLDAWIGTMTDGAV